MQTPSAIFNTLREASGNHITQKAVIEVGNYALAAKGASASASSEYSADWPAAGVVNGDFTHINAGAAGAAENGIGGAVWQSNSSSDGSGNITENLTVDLGQDRRVNRVALIFWPDSTKTGNLGSIGFKDFSLTKKVDGGGSFSAWSGLADKCAEIGKAATTISSGAVTNNTNDMVVFEDPTDQTFRYLKITITKLQAASVRARLVAVKITRAVDVSDAVTAASRQRHKDYHLEHRQATLLQLTLRNHDGRFNDRVTPTSSQVTAGWFNNLIRPNLEIRYYAGFSGVNCQMMSGFIDTWERSPDGRLVMITARDFFKFLIKPKLTTKLKTSYSLEALFEYVCNLQNFPSNMMVLDTTRISPVYFMPKDKTVQTILNDLQDATGSGESYADEFGRINFRSYLSVINEIWFQGSAGDFAAGTNVNNTDASSVSGALVLANVAGVYYTEGNWYSVLSPVLSGKVEFTTLLASLSTGPATSIDLFLRVTNDGGSTYTPWREILPGTRGIISKWNQWYGQIQVWARLRTSDTTTTPQLLDFTVKYRARGGSAMVNDSADWATKDTTTLLGMKRRLTDTVGGSNFMISESTVKAKPTFISSGTTDAWIGTYNGAEISVSNPLTVPLGDTTFVVDFGSKQFDAPQTVVITAGTAVVSTALTSDPSRPTLTITATTAGTITALKITGAEFIQTGLVQATAVANDQVVADYGANPDVLENDYIDNVDRAQSIADNLIALFGQGPLDLIPEAEVRFSPNAQLNDRVTVTDGFSGIADDYVVIGLADQLAENGSGFEAKTVAELVKIGAGAAAPDPAYYGSGGVFYFDNFRFGGSQTL